jgi:hypothetical protein
MSPEKSNLLVGPMAERIVVVIAVRIGTEGGRPGFRVGLDGNHVLERARDGPDTISETQPFVYGNRYFRSGNPPPPDHPVEVDSHLWHHGTRTSLEV